jgi:hypothetical protein
MVEDALKLYKSVVGSARAKIDIAKAREARRAEGSVLEYGLEYHLNLFISRVCIS